MATDEQWDRLTLSAKAAWRWAWATAAVRTGAAKPSDVLVDAGDDAVLSWARRVFRSTTGAEPAIRENAALILQETSPCRQ